METPKHLLYRTAKGNTVVLFGMEQEGRFWWAWIKNTETREVAKVGYYAFLQSSTQLFPNENPNPKSN